MSTRSPQLAKFVGAAMVVVAVATQVPTLLGLPSFFAALFGGYIPLSPGGVESVVLTLAALGVMILRISLGAGLVRLERGAWAPAVLVTFIDLILIGYWQVRILTSDTLHNAAGIGFSLLLLAVASNVAILALLYHPALLPALARARPSAGHRARDAMFIRIRDGWRSVGRSNAVTIVNVAPVNFILAPFSWALAALFYLVAVLPFRTWTGG